jgi:hypothetical protein
MVVVIIGRRRSLRIFKRNRMRGSTSSLRLTVCREILALFIEEKECRKFITRTKLLTLLFFGGMAVL